MFKIRCDKCKSKISKNFDFCPYCGFSIKKRKEGLLDEVSDMENVASKIGGFGVGEINQIFRQLQEGMAKDMKSQKKPISSGINITITMGGPKKISPEKINQEVIHQINEGNVEKMSKLPRSEPKSKVRRLSNSVVYEIDLPGVNSINDVFINKLNNSIEIRAIGKNKQYEKTIPVSLPIKKYYLSEGKLIIELKSQ